MAPGSLLAAWLWQYLQRPLGVLHGVAGTASSPRERRRSDDVCVEGCDGEVVRWAVWRVSWRRRGSLGGALTGGTRSSRWRCTGVLGVYAAVLGSVRGGYVALLGNRTPGEQRGFMAVLQCPPDPSNNSGGASGHPLALLTN